MKSVVPGIAWLAVATWFWLSVAGNPVDELTLIRRAAVAPGLIVHVWEDPGDGDDGATHWSHGVTYTYRLLDGRELTQRTKGSSGRLRKELRDLPTPIPVMVEYLPDNPKVSRIKGDGSPSAMDWFWRKVVVGGVFLALLLSPGVLMVRDGFRKMRNGGPGGNWGPSDGLGEDEHEDNDLSADEEFEDDQGESAEEDHERGI